MLVSLLQLMGFPAAKPLHSRAKEKPVARETEPQAATPKEQPARRSIVKKPVSASKKVAAKPAQSSHTSKVTNTTTPTPVAKTGKSGKTFVVPVKAKPLGGKTAVKASAKTTVKPKVEVAVKQAVTPLPAQKKSQTGVKVATVGKKAVAAGKSAVSVAPKPPTHLEKKSEPVSRVVESKVPVNKKPKTAKATSAAAPTPTAKPAAAADAAAPRSAAMDIPVRSVRPSSRLVQLTVPSIAQAVASNAAKASFTQLTSVQPIASPLPSAVKKDPKLANNWKKKAVDQLTDDEIIAMSDQDYMNDTQLAYFRLKLVNLKNDILSNAGETTEHLREDTVVVPDPADRATIEEEHALELRTRDRERKLLKKIEQSINRIDAGDYGYCDETGEPIGVARLLARPTATLSLEAQQRRELKQKMFGD